VKRTSRFAAMFVFTLLGLLLVISPTYAGALKVPLNTAGSPKAACDNLNLGAPVA
jgi:hypothetical protein